MLRATPWGVVTLSFGAPSNRLGTKGARLGCIGRPFLGLVESGSGYVKNLHPKLTWKWTVASDKTTMCDHPLPRPPNVHLLRAFGSY